MAAPTSGKHSLKKPLPTEGRSYTAQLPKWEWQLFKFAPGTSQSAVPVISTISWLIRSCSAFAFVTCVNETVHRAAMPDPV